MDHAGVKVGYEQLARARIKCQLAEAGAAISDAVQPYVGEQTCLPGGPVDLPYTAWPAILGRTEQAVCPLGSRRAACEAAWLSAFATRCDRP